MMKFFLLTLFVAAVAADVPQYTKSDFEAKLKDAHHFIMFYAPWCGHCKNLKPTWAELGEKFDEASGVVVAKVDCTEETGLCSDQDVTGYPTLKFFSKDADKKEGSKYRGQRDLDSLVKFVKKSIGEEVEEEEVEEPEEPQIANGLTVLNEKSFDNHVKKGKHFVKFYAPWCGHCQKLAPTWDELAKSFESEEGVSIAKLDCTKAQNVCQMNDVKGYPTLAFFNEGKKVEVYRGSRTAKDLQDYVKSMLDDNKEAKDEKESKDTATEDGDAPVVVVDKDNFEKEISEGVAFVKFFAPWCGHCKRLAPVWSDLARRFKGQEGVKIVKVDCTSNDNLNQKLCNDQGVGGFPTLIAFKDGKKVKEYSGQRNIDDLVAFVNKIASSSKDEL